MAVAMSAFRRRGGAVSAGAVVAVMFGSVQGLGTPGAGPVPAPGVPGVGFRGGVPGAGLGWVQGGRTAGGPHPDPDRSRYRTVVFGLVRTLLARRAHRPRPS